MLFNLMGNNLLYNLPPELHRYIYMFLNPITIPYKKKSRVNWCDNCGEILEDGDWFMSFGNEDFFNLKLANHLGGKTEVTYNYDYNINGSSPRIASIRIDIVTDEYVIEGGLDKRSSLDSIQQAVFASTLTGKKPAVAIYDTNGSWGKYEHRIYSSAKKLGIKFFWVSGNKIHEK